MKTKLFYLTMALVMALSLVAVAVPLANPAEASPMQTLNINFNAAITVDGNYRAHNLLSGDEVIQFTRADLTVGTSPSGGFHTATTSSGSVTGDLTGTITAVHNSLDIWWTELGGVGKGYCVGTFTFDDGDGNTFEGVQVGDIDYTFISPQVVKSDVTGYMVSTAGTGDFAGKIVLGTFSTSTGVGGDYTLAAGTATLRVYDADEITQLPATTWTGTVTTGNTNNIPTQTGDVLVQFTGSNYITPGVDNTSIEDASGGMSVSLAAGPFTGAIITASRNAVTYFTYPTCRGWAAGTFLLTKDASTIKGVMVTDILTPSSQTGYLFALKSGSTSGDYAGKEYFGTFDNTVELIGEPTKDIDGSADFYELEGVAGCFIATAAYGTDTAGQLDVLRAFRDQVLLESTLGSQLVALYYDVSPPIADFIAENDLLRATVRELLIDPIVTLAQLTAGIWGD